LIIENINVLNLKLKGLRAYSNLKDVISKKIMLKLHFVFIEYGRKYNVNIIGQH